MPLLVGQDAARDLGGQRVGGAVAQGLVVPQGHHLGDHQHQQFHPQSEEPPDPDEGRVAPVPVEGGGPAGGQQQLQHPRVVLFLGDEEPDRLGVDRITREVGLAGECGAVAVLADLELLDAADDLGRQLRALAPVGVAQGRSALPLGLELAHPCPVLAFDHVQ